MAITVPVPQTALSVSGWGKPITDQVNANITDITNLKSATTPTAWAQLTLQNSWANLASPRNFGTSWRKIGDIVYLRIAVGGGTNGAVITTLPAGARPVATMDFMFRSGGSTPATLNVNLDGTVVAYLASGADNGLVAGTAIFATV